MVFSDASVGKEGDKRQDGFSVACAERKILQGEWPAFPSTCGKVTGSDGL